MLLACLVVPLATAIPTAARAAEPVSEQEARAIGVEAYLYLYPLVTMDISRKVFTNGEPDVKLGRGPMNAFTNVPEYPPPSLRVIVRPNFDTLCVFVTFALFAPTPIAPPPEPDDVADVVPSPAGGIKTPSGMPPGPR